MIENSDGSVIQLPTCTACDMHVIRPQTAARGRVANVLALFVYGTTSISDVKNNHPLSGRYTKIILDILDGYGLYDICGFANIISCVAQYTPYLDSKCSKRFILYLKLLTPKIIVTVGKTAYTSIVGNATHYARDLYKPINQDGYVIIPIEHPLKIRKSKDSTRYVKFFNTLAKVANNTYYKRLIQYDNFSHLGI